MFLFGLFLSLYLKQYSMKASILFFGCFFSLFVPFCAVGQETQQPAPVDLRFQKPSTFKENMIFKPTIVEADNVELIEVVALGTPSFKVSNTADGTYESYSHALRINYPLVLTSGKTGFMLCFYGPSEKIAYSVETKEGVTTIYFPVSAHDVVKTRIDQTLATKKKIAIKLSQLADGYREALIGGN
jgi:hypothetical protein